MKRPIDRYVDSLLHRRRPKPFPPTEDDLAIARTAINLAAAAPDAHRPREAFVEELRRRLAEQADNPQPATAPPAAYGSRGRRRFLAATALAATGAAVAVVGEAVVERTATDPGPEAGATGATGATGTPGATGTTGPTGAGTTGEGDLTPDIGIWQTVANATDLHEGEALPFDLGAVSGFLRRESGRVQAVSGTCTHQGCRLRLDTPRNQLACPCHGATFTLAGAPLTRPHGSHPLPALPRLAVRVVGGEVQVYAPGPGGGVGAGTAMGTGMGMGETVGADGGGVGEVE